MVAFNDGQGGFLTPVALSSEFCKNSSKFAYTSWNTYPRFLGDIDGDGMKDIIGYEDNTIQVAFSNGRSAFTDSITYAGHFTRLQGGWVTHNDYPRGVGDVDGDGKDDLINFGEAGPTVLISGGRGPYVTSFLGYSGFNKSNGWSSNNSYPRFLADINGDGMADIVGFY